MCEDCRIPIGDNISALQCDHCESAEAWKCTNCLGISDDVYQKLINNKNLKRFCQGCNSLVSSDPQTGNNMDKVLEKVNKLVELISDWDSKMVDRVRTEVSEQLSKETLRWNDATSQISDRVARCEQKMEEYNKETYNKMAQCEATLALLLDQSKELASAKTGIVRLGGIPYDDVNWPPLGCTGPSQTVTDNENIIQIVEKAVNKQQVEDKEIEARKNNLVLYNIPENQSERYETRVQADKDFIVKMCDDVAGVQITDSDVLKSVRLGAIVADKIRPLLVTLSSEGTKEEIMRMARELGRSGKRYSRIGIAHDYTPRQREENRKILEEAKAEIEANGESPENYKLYVTRRNTRPEVIKKKRYKVVQQTQNKEETAPKYTGEERLPCVTDSYDSCTAMHEV